MLARAEHLGKAWSYSPVEGCCQNQVCVGAGEAGRVLEICLWTDVGLERNRKGGSQWFGKNKVKDGSASLLGKRLVRVGWQRAMRPGEETGGSVWKFRSLLSQPSSNITWGTGRQAGTKERWRVNVGYKHTNGRTVSCMALPGSGGFNTPHRNSAYSGPGVLWPPGTT